MTPPHRPGIQWFRVLGVLTGLGMTAGFGALTLHTAREYLAFPAAPRPITVAGATASAQPPAGSWVTLTDLRLPCEYGEGRGASGSNRYRVGTGADGRARIVVAARALPTCDVPVNLTGVISSSAVGRIVGLEFPGHPWSAWPSPWQITLWTHSGPADSRTGLVFLPWMVLIGVIITLVYGWPAPAPKRRVARALSALDPGRLPHLRASATPQWTPILPARPLALARGHWRRVALIAAALVTFGGFLATLGTWGVLEHHANSPTRDAAGYFFDALIGAIGLLGVFLIGLVGPVVWRAVQAARGFRGRHVEVLLPIEDVTHVVVNGIHSGSSRLAYKHPATGKRAEVMASVMEQPIVFDGFLVGVHPDGDPKTLVILQEGFAPFGLSDEEEARAEEALAARVAAQGVSAGSG
jgi:hypothetical protein